MFIELALINTKSRSCTQLQKKRWKEQYFQNSIYYKSKRIVVVHLKQHTIFQLSLIAQYCVLFPGLYKPVSLGCSKLKANTQNNYRNCIPPTIASSVAENNIKKGFCYNSSHQKYKRPKKRFVNPLKKTYFLRQRN